MSSDLRLRIEGLQTSLVKAATKAVGAASLTDMEPEARAEILAAALALSELSNRHLGGEDVSAELAHERARLLLWAWVGAAEVREAWRQFLDRAEQFAVASISAIAAGLFAP